MKHEIIKIDSGFECTVCGWHWKSRPSSDCPGVRRYEWLTAPENLRTEGQLRKRKLMPGGPKCGVVQGGKGEYELFDLAQAVPVSEEILKAEREQRRKARLRKCAWCKKEVYRERWDEEYHACKDCLPGAIQAVEERERAKEERRQKAMDKMFARDRNAAIDWARALFEEKDQVVILDTETTGLDYDAEIVQVSLIDMEGRVLMDTLVKPSISIPEDAIRIHGITNEMVVDAPRFAEIDGKLMDLVRNKILVIYNVSFDIRMIAQSSKGTSGIVARRLACAMSNYASFVGEWNDYHGNYKWQRLPGGDHLAASNYLSTDTLEVSHA